MSELLVTRGEQLERVKELVYLGSTLTKNRASVTEIERRINLGYYKFYELNMKPDRYKPEGQGAKIPGNSIVNGIIRS